MKSFLEKLRLFPTGLLQGLLALFGALIAIQINYIQHGWVNNDSVLYFEAARLFTLGQWREGFDLFPWPLYSSLIALVHYISGFSLHFSAQILNVVFFGVATLSFLRLIRLCGGDNFTILCGAFLLLSSQYIVGDALQMLLRDQGFWAFFLTALVFFVCFYRSSSWQDAILWQLSMIIATLFRIEGITYLIILPCIFLINDHNTWKDRGISFLKAHSISVTIGAIVAGYLFFNGLSVAHLGRLQEVFTSDLVEELTKLFVSRADIMADTVLGNYLDDFAVEGLLLTFTFIVLAKTISTAGWITIGLAAYASKLRQSLIESDAWRILAAVAIISLADMLLIILKVFVLSSRYTVPLTLILIVLGAFGLKQLIQKLDTLHTSRRTRWLITGLVIILMLGMVKNVLPKQEGYHYELDAIAWLKQHNTQNLPTYYETPRMRYYAGEEFIGTGSKLNWSHLQELIEKDQLDDYEFVLVSINKNDPKRIAYLTENLHSHEKVAEFKAVKGRKAVLIYQRR